MTSHNPQGGIFRPLTQAQVENIHAQALFILENTGMTYEAGLEDILPLFEKGGCRVERQEARIYFPPELVADCMDQAPSRVVIHGRQGQADLDLSGHRVYCGAGGSAVRILDLESGQARPSRLGDIYDMARLVERLDHIHFYMAPCVPHDIDPTEYDVNRIFASLVGSNKPMVLGVHDHEQFRQAAELAALAAGGKERLLQRPILGITSGVIISPLKFNTQACRNVLAAVRYGLPAVVVSAPMAGSTSPITMAGTVLQTHAEVLAGLTMCQLAAPGCSLIYGGMPALADLRTMGYRGGAVECGLMAAAMHQMSHHVGLPNYASSGLSDAKLPDTQAGWEKAFTTLLNVMGGCNFIHHAAGMLESILCIAPESYVIDDEIIGCALRALDEMRTGGEDLALEAIQAVGPGGNYMMSPHTIQRMRSEHFQGNGISHTGSRRQWEQEGSKDARQRARERAREILAAEPPRTLEPEVIERIRRRFPIRL